MAATGPRKSFSLWKGLTLQFLFFTTILPLTVILLIITFSSLSLHQRAMRALVGDRDERAVRTAASAIETELRYRSSAIQLLAIKVMDTSPEALAETLATSYFLLADFDGGLAYLDADGNPLGATNDPVTWYSWSELMWPLPLVPGVATLSSPFRLSEADPWLMVVAMPADEGLTVVGAFTPAGIIQKSLANTLVGNEDLSVFVLDADYNIIFQQGTSHLVQDPVQHPGVAQALAGSSGADHLHDEHGEHIVAYSPIPLVQWALVIEEPWEMVASTLLETTLLAPLGLVFAILITVGGMWFGIRQIVKPLEQLEEKTNRLAWGDFTAVSEPVGGIVEIQNLQSGLIHMASKIQDAQENLHSYIGAITKGQEEERLRMARELHDDTIQALIALKQRVQLAQLSNKGKSEMVGLVELEQLTEGTIENLRRLTRALRPIYLEDLGLVAALGMLTQEITQISGVSVEFKIEGRERRLQPEIELALYRIAQEALSNVARHAQASQALIRLHYRSELVDLEVSDDGNGFNVPNSPAEFVPAGHYGLLGIYERAQLIGAQLTIDSAPGRGTQINVTLREAIEMC
jgi:signal transduction histidine kinase